MVQKAKAVGLAFDDSYLASEINADYAGDAHDSKTGIFRFVSTFRRSLGLVWPKTEAVHPGVIDRQQAGAPPYNPENLVEYQKSDGYNVATVSQPDTSPVPSGLRTDR